MVSDLAIPRPRTPDFQALYADLRVIHDDLRAAIEELIAEAGGPDKYWGARMTAALRPGGPR